MTAVFRLPDLGEGLTEAEILEWKVAVGDTVTVDQLVVEVETAKAAVDVPVPFAGTVAELFAPAGSTIAVGSPLIAVDDGSPASDSTGSAAADRYREEEQAGSGNVLIGYGTGHGPGGGRRRRGTRKQAEAVPPVAVPDVTAAPLVISPLVRKLAKEHGIDVATVTATGPGGVVLRRDVEAVIARSTATTTAHPAPRASEAGEVRIPLRGLRKVVADKLVRSRTEIPDATTWVDVDATKLMEAKRVLGAAGRPVSLLALLARITVAGLVKYPELNASVDLDAGEIVRHAGIGIGFAAQTDRGLVVPVVRGAESMSAMRLGAELARLTEAARQGKLGPEDLTGGTFTLNNYGVFGVDGSTPIINHPEAALLGVGRIVDKPWVVDGALAVRKVTQLSLTFDHRVCDGGAAGGFLRYVADCVEHPEILLADI